MRAWPKYTSLRIFKLYVVLVCLLIIFVGCSGGEQVTLSSPSGEPAEPTPVTQTSDSVATPLNEQDIVQLKERFPSRQLEVLKNAKHVDVFEIAECLTDSATGKPNEHGLWPIEKNTFQGCLVSRQARVSDSEERKEFVDAVIYSIASWGNGNACWGPRHGIRVVHNEERIELLICFECENFRGAPAFGAPLVRTFDGNYIGGRERFGGGFSPEIEPLFEKILSRVSKR